VTLDLERGCHRMSQNRLYDELAKLSPSMGVEEWREAVKETARRVSAEEAQERREAHARQVEECRRINADARKR
jgi:hypothetical protein